MFRVILVNLALLLLPTILYGVYVYLARRSAPPGEAVSGAPFLWLFAAGVLLMLASMAYFIQFSEGGKPGQAYHPPEYKDGKIIPGHFE